MTWCILPRKTLVVCWRGRKPLGHDKPTICKVMQVMADILTNLQELLLLGLWVCRIRAWRMRCGRHSADKHQYPYQLQVTSNEKNVSHEVTHTSLTQPLMGEFVATKLKRLMNTVRCKYQEIPEHG